MPLFDEASISPEVETPENVETLKVGQPSSYEDCSIVALEKDQFDFSTKFYVVFPDGRTGSIHGLRDNAWSCECGGNLGIEKEGDWVLVTCNIVPDEPEKAIPLKIIGRIDTKVF